MRLLFFAVMSLFPFAHVFAQTDDVKKEINKIKKSSRYIYAESTAPSMSDAKYYAEKNLYEAVNEWIQSKKKKPSTNSLIINNKQIVMLGMPRGSNMHRAFLYVKKSDIIPTDDAVVIDNAAAPPVSEKIEIDIPEPIKILAQISNFDLLVKSAKEMQRKGTIKRLDRYDKFPDVNVCYLVIFNDDGQILAILTPGTERYNIHTNEQVSLLEYRGCRVVGIEL